MSVETRRMWQFGQLALDRTGDPYLGALTDDWQPFSELRERGFTDWSYFDELVQFGLADGEVGPTRYVRGQGVGAQYWFRRAQG